MKIRFYRDPESGEPHIWDHGIMEYEVYEVMGGRGEDIPGRGNSRIRIGRTIAGRHIKVIYIPDEDRKGLFMVTAYEIRGRAKRAFHRRQRRKPR